MEQLRQFLHWLPELRFEHGSTNLMDRFVNRSPSFVTHLAACTLLFVRQMVACALILITISGCSLLENSSSFNRPRQTENESSLQSEPAETKTPVISSNSDIEMTPDEQAFAKAFEEPSTPSARLLTPEFGDDGSSSAKTTESTTGGHSMGQNTSPASHTMYPATSRPVSQARALFDEPPSQVTVERDPRSLEAMNQTINAMAVNQPDIRSVQDTQPVVEQISAESVSHEIPAEPHRAGPPQEQSLFDRLRGFAPERNATGLLKRPFGKIPNPWDWEPFGNRDDTKTAPQSTPEATAEQAPAIPVPDPGDADELLQTLIAISEQKLEQWPQTDDGSPLQPREFQRRQLNLRLLRLVSDEPAAASEAIESMSPEEQEFWQELILGISQFRNPDQNMDYDEHIAATIGQLKQAVQQLEPLASLAIRRLEFCSKVHRFGSIDTFLSNTFEPGQRVLIYAEVENLQAELSPLDTYRISFSGTLELWSISSAEWIKSWPLPLKTDDSTTRRADYYQSYEFPLPAHLPQDDYEIRIQIRDDMSGRTVDGTLKFAIQ